LRVISKILRLNVFFDHVGDFSKPYSVDSSDGSANFLSKTVERLLIVGIKLDFNVKICSHPVAPNVRRTSSAGLTRLF